MTGKFVDLPDSVDGFRRIAAGEFDHLPEQAFYMVGGLDEVVAKGEEIAAAVAARQAEDA
jgi:F-type H+-transporting ATPase subunit beta